MKFIDALNLFTYNSAAIVLYFPVIYVFYSNQNHEQNFWKKFTKINREFCGQNDLKMWSCLNKLILLDDILFEYKTNYIIKLMSFISFVILDSRIQLYFLHVQIIAFQLRNIHSNEKTDWISAKKFIKSNLIGFKAFTN